VDKLEGEREEDVLREREAVQYLKKRALQPAQST
jgi:hypothetical protein